MKAKTVAFVLTAALAVYLVLVGLRGWALIQSGDPIAVGLGLAVLVLPALAIVLIFREIRFGQATARLGSLLSQRQQLPVDDLPRRPSGRPVRQAADARAQRCIEEVKNEPDNWVRWFELSVAYDWASDRTRARSAMRKAIDLERKTSGAQ